MHDSIKKRRTASPVHLSVSKRYWSRCQLVVTTSACIQSMYIQSSFSLSPQQCFLCCFRRPSSGMSARCNLSLSLASRAPGYQRVIIRIPQCQWSIPPAGISTATGRHLPFRGSSRIEISAIDLRLRVNREVCCLFHLSWRTWVGLMISLASAFRG